MYVGLHLKIQLVVRFPTEGGKGLWWTNLGLTWFSGLVKQGEIDDCVGVYDCIMCVFVIKSITNI